MSASISLKHSIITISMPGLVIILMERVALVAVGTVAQVVITMSLTIIRYPVIIILVVLFIAVSRMAHVLMNVIAVLVTVTRMAETVAGAVVLVPAATILSRTIMSTTL